MKPVIRNSMIAALAIFALNSQAYSSESAQANNASSLTSFKTTIQLVQKGVYGDIYEIEKEYGFVKVKVRDENGDRLKLAVVPETGKITVLEKKNKRPKKQYQAVNTQISLDQALNIVSQQGYSSVEEIELENGYYGVEVRDENGRKHDIAIDAQTGEILPQWKTLFR